VALVALVDREEMAEQGEMVNQQEPVVPGELRVHVLLVLSVVSPMVEVLSVIILER
jgi:hypothetical protein